LKHGYIDVRVLPPSVEFDPGRNGFVIKFIIEEGDQFRVGTVDVRSNVRALEPSLVRSRLRVSPGEVFNTEAVEKTVEDMTIEAARQGFAFVQVRPRADRDSQSHTVNIAFSVAGGYSTADGFMGEVSIGERNLLGLGLYAKAAVQYGQHAQGYQLSFVEPYLLGYRVAWGLDLSQKIQKSTQFTSYETRTIG